ncbi:hypothetical protein K443DRAFT_671474 [Laccaria amethystina LaAM-08-1]|uniref:protein-tyrosine-phosphatase n=1 Tax=Laccaria amethystina LaAM-08-1 TaxID=1095629 RepID=A0A0C9XBE3_9AGAR|nr:hypothetical protein K443DRAFT_671474 [Laccaria amethystina LaAM-08-1]
MVKEPPIPRSPLPGAKRFRPPNIDLTRVSEKRRPTVELESESPASSLNLQLSDDDILQLSSPESSPSTSPVSVAAPSLNIPTGEDTVPDDLSKDLAALERLRKSVQQNLRLRPIRSRSNLKVDLSVEFSPPKTPRSPFTPSAISPSRKDSEPLSAISPTSSISSSYFTPTAETPHSSLFSGSSHAERFTTVSISQLPHSPISISPKMLYDRMVSPKRPLLIDTRTLVSHQEFHVQYSINIAIPSLILKRCRKPGGGFQTLDALRQFITSDQEKAEWDSFMRSEGAWDGDVVVYDDEMNLRDKDNASVTAWAVIHVISPLLSYGSVSYLDGGISIAGHHPYLERLIITEGEPASHVTDKPTPQGTLQKGPKKGAGLFQLDTQTAFRSKQLPELEPSSSTASNPPSPLPRSPLPMMPSVTSSRTLSSADSNKINIVDATPSPTPSSVGFRRPLPPRRPSVPNLRRIDTKSNEQLNGAPPKLSVRTKPMRSATLAVPPSLSLSLQIPTSPSHLNLLYSTHSPPASARWTPSSPSINDPANYLTPYFTPPHTPGTPKPFLPPSPHTARPELDPPTTDDSFPVFTISTILPNFLYLGPELTTQEHVGELQELGVRRILNIAAECDDDQGLRLREVFEKYFKIPMRDTVEEENIAQGVKEVCEILDDARLHSAPTYVHCKAGKSRSVTAVMAYLIHANHWTLSRAYSFVLERRKGISPNIGFVSELMTFEEQELGGKSVGVQPSAPMGGSSTQDNGGADSYGAAVGRRSGHVRESLPPALGGLDSLGVNGGPMSAGGLMERVMGDSGQEMEIKDSSGRYRHARRAPVDENTLQPMRRVSKAGLESLYG